MPFRPGRAIRGGCVAEGDAGSKRRAECHCRHGPASARSGRPYVLTSQGSPMPVVRVSFYQGRSAKQKLEIAEAITEALVRIAGSKREAVNVIFDNIAEED